MVPWHLIEGVGSDGARPGPVCPFIVDSRSNGFSLDFRELIFLEHLLAERKG